MKRFMLSDDLSTLEKYINRQDTDSGITVESPPLTKYNNNRNYDYTKGSVSRFRPPARAIRTTSSITSSTNRLPKPSKEQRKICTIAQKGYSVVIDSVFGCGKTTTILHICQQLPTKRILVLTYNSRLKLETRSRVHNLGLEHVQVHSYHAFGVRYYRSDCVTDHEIKQIVSESPEPRRNIQFDLIILDEQQDMTPLYYQFTRKIITDRLGDTPPQIILFGDTYQNIYAFMGADARFLNWGDRLFNGATPGWKKKKITTSFRTTYPIAHFINRHLVRYNRIVAQKDGGAVRYLLCDSFGMTPFQEINSYLAMGYRPDDIYILAPSLRISKNLSPVRRLENRLVNKGIPCFVPTNDEEDVRESVTKGKIVFSTYHQVKGSERPVVLVFNFDASYYDYYAKEELPNRCPNTVYVALSRSMERLSVIHHYENGYFPTLDLTNLHDDPRIDVVQTRKLTHKFQGESLPKREIKTPIVNLLRHLDISTVQTALNFLDYKIYRDTTPSLEIPGVVEMEGGNSESVSDITGIAIPAGYEISTTGRSSILKWICRESEKLSPDHHQVLGRLGSKIKQGIALTIPELLHLSNLYLSVVSGWTSKLHQITNYDWIKEDVLDQANHRLRHAIGENDNDDSTNTKQFQVEVERPILGRLLMGRIDMVDTNCCYQFKCTTSLESEHLLQLAILAWAKYANKDSGKLTVFNILSGERIELSVTDSIGDMVYYLVDQKYKSTPTLTDAEFMEKIQQLPTTERPTIPSAIENTCLI
jgi:hypothetical protein